MLIVICQFVYNLFLNFRSLALTVGACALNTRSGWEIDVITISILEFKIKKKYSISFVFRLSFHLPHKRLQSKVNWKKNLFLWCDLSVSARGASRRGGLCFAASQVGGPNGDGNTPGDSSTITCSSTLRAPSFLSNKSFH